MNPYNLSILCFGFCSFLLGLLVWLKRQDAVGNRYLGLSLCYAGWAFFISINLNNDVSPDVGLFMGRLGNGFALFIPPFWYHFVVSFIGNAKKRLIFVRLFYLIAVVIGCFAFSPWFIPGVRPMVGFSYYSQAGPIFYFNTGFFFFVVLLSFYELFRKIRKTEGFMRQQLTGLFWTALIGYVGGGPTFLPIHGIPFPQYALFLLPVYPFGLTYVMIKQKLFDVEELAQAAHRDKLMAIGVLAASINHEVRNPLYIIRELAGSWIDRKKEGVFRDDKQIIEKSEEAMKRSMEQADRAMDIIKRLSLFAKSGIESELKFEQIKLASVLEDILPLIRYELAANNIALSREIPPDLPDVYADRRYLEEILFNLLVNACQAIKATGKPGEIKVTAEIAEGDSPSEAFKGTVPFMRRVLVRVSDTGPGIPPDKIAHVFRPFYTTKEEGTGLGLYITKQLVEKIKGRIDVSSTPGSGTTFVVSLPVKISEVYIRNGKEITP